MDREKPLLSAPPAFIALRTALPNPSPDFTPDWRIPLIPGWVQPFLQRHPAQIPAQEMGWAPPLPAAELPGLQLMNAISADGFIVIREPGRARLRRREQHLTHALHGSSTPPPARQMLLAPRCCCSRAEGWGGEDGREPGRFGTAELPGRRGETWLVPSL